MRLLITGGAGFIGSNFVHLLRRERPGWTLSVLDLLTYAGHAANLEPHLGDGSVALQVGDVAEPEVVDQAMRDVDAVVHFAALHQPATLAGVTEQVHKVPLGSGQSRDPHCKGGGLPDFLIPAR